MKLFAPTALLPEGWADNVSMSIDAGGAIASVRMGEPEAAAEHVAGALVPGMANVHSHAFQRGIAGRTGRVLAGEGASFWTWRYAMYSFVHRLDPDALEAVAAQAYLEMVKAGYTSVAEFHYVHHDPRGRPYADPAELSHRVLQAARETSIALTLLPVFYAHAGFGGQPPAGEQRRFVHAPVTFSRLLAALQASVKGHEVVLGVAPHSLRAVLPDELGAIKSMVSAQAPIHIHAAEQLREVEECVHWSGQRPVEWLLAHAGVDARWCLVHATHMNATETAGLARSGAVAGLAPTTEADLGDGTFNGTGFLDEGGRFGVGSDSNTIVDPFAELRQLEWSQRLARQARNVLASHDGANIGTALWSHAASAGAQAIGRPAGAIAVGRRADLVVLNPADVALATTPRDALLDAAIFGPCRAPVRDVMIGGRWVVRDGHHRAEERITARFLSTMAALEENG